MIDKTHIRKRGRLKMSSILKSIIGLEIKHEERVLSGMRFFWRHN